MRVCQLAGPDSGVSYLSSHLCTTLVDTDDDYEDGFGRIRYKRDDGGFLAVKLSKCEARSVLHKTVSGLGTNMSGLLEQDSGQVLILCCATLEPRKTHPLFQAKV